MIPPSWIAAGCCVLALSGALYALKASYERNGTLEATISQQAATEAALRRAAEVYAEEIKRQHERAAAHRAAAAERIKALEGQLEDIADVPVQICFDDPVPEPAADVLRQLAGGAGDGVPGTAPAAASLPGADPGPGAP